MAETNPGVRYAQLLAFIPEGNTWDSDGTVVPYRSSPYTLQFVTETPNQVYSLFKNQEFIQQVKTDGAGNVVVDVQVDLGENRIYIFDPITEVSVQILLCAKNAATLLASVADQFEAEDAYLNELLAATSLTTCQPDDLAAVYGVRVNFPAIYPSDVYRELLIELHNAQRLYAGKLAGIEAAVGAVCQVPPLDLFRMFAGPRWVLKQTFLENDHFQDRSFSANPNPLFPGIVSVEYTANAQPGNASLDWNPPNLTYNDPVYGALTLPVPAGYQGILEFRGAPEDGAIVGLVGPYLIVAAQNDSLLVNVDHLGQIEITLPAGVQTAAAIAAVINAALVAQPQYGALYAATASDVGGHLRLGSLQIGPSAGVTLYASLTPGQAVTTLFDIPVADLPTTFEGMNRVFARVTVDATLLGAAQNLPFVLTQSPLPDNWFCPFGTVASPIQPTQFFQDTEDGPELQVSLALSGEAVIQKRANPEVDTYKGWDFNLGAWIRTLDPGIQVVYGYSFDGGNTWIEEPAQNLTQQVDAADIPTYTEVRFIYDPEAIDLWVRLRFVGAAGQTVFVNRVVLRQEKITGAYLASKTVPRSRHRSFFGHLVYAWCVDLLEATEAQTVSLTSPPWVNAQIEALSPAHIQVDRFNVTEFDLFTGIAKNLRGVLTEADWATATLTNLEIVPRAPSRFTYVAPTVAGEVTTEGLSFPNIAPFLAGLPYPSDMDLSTSILFEDDVPVPQDSWQYINETTILVDAGIFQINSIYKLRYRCIYRAISDVIDLLPSSVDYVWYADYHLVARHSAEVTQIEDEIVLFIDFQTLIANLDRRVVPDQSLIRIFRNDGNEIIELPQAAYVIVNPTTLQFDGAYIKGGSIYTMVYSEQGMINPVRCTPVFYARTAVDPVALLAAPWRVIDRNVAIKTDGRQYAQLRLDITGVDHPADIRLTSLVAKGLHLFGPLAAIPGVT